MKRYLLIVAASPNGETAEFRRELMAKLRSIGVRLINARAGSAHVEIDLYSDDIGIDIEKVRTQVGEVIDLIDLGKEMLREKPFEAFACLFNSERFWEAHEILEVVWRGNRDKLVQGLIVLAAAFAKLQEGSEVGFKKLAVRSLNMLSDARQVECIDLETIRANIELSLSTRKPFIIECKK